MFRVLLFLFAIASLVGACESAGSPALAPSDTGAVAQDLAGPDLVAGVDLPSGGPDLPLAPDLPNTPPTLGPLPPVELDMGSTTMVELADLLDDAEDPESALVLSWSAEHVALSELTNRVLLVVAPVDWYGEEGIDITVTDTGGLTATAPLVVTVNQVVLVAPDVVTPSDTGGGGDTGGAACPETVFAVQAGTGARDVWLAGSFNGWASEPAAGADVLSDPDGDGLWSVSLALAPGRYEYKFIIDGTWTYDEANPERVSDTHGGFNSVLHVPECEE